MCSESWSLLPVPENACHDLVAHAERQIVPSHGIVGHLPRDAEVGCREQETKIAGYLHEHQRACVVAINKWDRIAKGQTTFEETVAEVRRRLKVLDYAPIVNQVVE